jgi:hypothetical protein
MRKIKECCMKNSPNLKDLADEAMSSLSIDIDDDEFEKIDALSDLDKVRMRYKHADCDDFAFALNVLMGWPVLCVVSSSKGPIHRLVQIPLGVDDFKAAAYVDVDGYVSKEDLCRRYKSKNLKFVDGAPFLSSTLDDDDSLRRVMSTFAYLPFAPFSDQKFRSALSDWIERGSYFDAEPPINGHADLARDGWVPCGPFKWSKSVGERSVVISEQSAQPGDRKWEVYLEVQGYKYYSPHAINSFEDAVADANRIYRGCESSAQNENVSKQRSREGF